VPWINEKWEVGHGTERTRKKREEEAIAREKEKEEEKRRAAETAKVLLEAVKNDTAPK